VIGFAYEVLFCITASHVLHASITLPIVQHSVSIGIRSMNCCIIGSDCSCQLTETILPVVVSHFWHQLTREFSLLLEPLFLLTVS
jgi:hypothetical protein